MGAEQEQHNRDAEEKLLGRGVLGAIVNLLPHIEVVKGAAVEFKWNAAHVVEHDVRPDHVGYVGQCPRRLLRDAGNHVVKDLEAGYQDKVNGPCSYTKRHVSIVFLPLGPRLATGPCYWRSLRAT